MKPNNFLHRIDKEAVNKMPIAEFDGEVIIVNCLEQVPEAMAYLNAQTRVGVDTETRPSFVRGQHYPTALVQIATLERCYLFQLTQIDFPAQLAAFFSNPAIQKIGLAFKDDLTGLRRRRNFTAKACIDVQQLVGQYGILDLGLQKIFAILFGKKISKAQQLTNWENMALTPEQARYASTDAWATLLIYNELLRTKPLPKRDAEALRRADLELQQQHQQQVMAERMNQQSAPQSESKQ